MLPNGGYRAPTIGMIQEDFYVTWNFIYTGTPFTLRLKAWAEKLDRVKGELTVQKIVDELYDWTARRMEDAWENDSRADEMLLKRCAYHGLIFTAGRRQAGWSLEVELSQDGEADAVVYQCTIGELPMKRSPTQVLMRRGLGGLIFCEAFIF